MRPPTTWLPEIFSLSPLIVAGIVGILIGVVEFGMFMEWPLFFLVAVYIVWITANYFLEIVEYKALGGQDWPVFSLETLVARRSQVGVVSSVLALTAAGAYGALRYYGNQTAAESLLVAGLIVLPGSVALLAVTRDFFAALNPLRILAAALGMGHAYLYCLLGAAAVFGLLELARERGGLWYFPLVYSLFLLAYLIGSIVYARRRSLGVRAPRSPEALAERARAETIAVRERILSHVYGFSAHGNKAGALKHIDSYIETEEDTLEARLWVFSRIARWEDSHVALEFGRRVIDYCERHGLADEASRVRSACEHLRSREERA